MGPVATPLLAGAPVHLGLALGDIHGPAQEVLLGDVRAAQPARPAAAGVKRRPAVHGAQVVEEHALARLHLVAVHGGGVVDQALEQPGGLDPARDVPPRVAFGVAVRVAALERRRPVHACEAAVAADVHDGPVGVVEVPVLVVLVGHPVLRQAGHLAAAAGDKGPQEAADALAVAEERLAARARVLHAVQDLDHGRRLQVAQVLVQAEVAARVGDVFGVGLGAHVKGAAVEGLADVGDARRDVHDGRLVARHVLQVDDAQAADVDDGVPEAAAALHELGVVYFADVLVQGGGVPVLDARAAEDAVLRGWAGRGSLEGGAELVPGEDHLVAWESGDVVGEADG